MLMNSADYRESLRRYSPRVFVDGARIDSVLAPLAVRQEAWRRLARDLDAGALNLITAEVPLDDAIAQAGALLAGGVRGRVVVSI